MQSHTKKAKLRVAEQDDTFVFMLGDNPIDPRLIFLSGITGGYGKAVELVILKHPRAPAILAAISRNPMAADYIARHKLWLQLVKRDYLAQFSYAYDENRPVTNMRQHVMDVLDNLSERPERLETYWKRFYELQKSKTIPLRDPEQSPWFYVFTRGDFENLADRRYETSELYTPTILANANVIAYVVPVYNDYRYDADEGVEVYDPYTPTEMKVIMESGQMDIVPYDMTLISVLPTRPRTNATEMSFLDRTGIGCVYLSVYKGKAVKIAHGRLTTLKKKLVSCRVCGEPAEYSVQFKPELAYCGERCFRESFTY